jgi:hypothetical protein
MILLLLLLVVAALLLLFSGCTAARCTGIAVFGNLGADVNSPYDEYAPALSDTATLVFTSNRIEEGRGGLQEQYRAIRPAHLFLSMRLADSWDVAQRYRLMLADNASGDGDAGTITFAPPGSPFNVTAYIGACERENSIGGCDLYAVTEGASSAVVNPGAGLNSASWDGQPSITPDGKRLYFASDRAGKGSMGGSDIWIAERTTAGTWGDPYNAGPGINTPGDEYSPFFDATHHRLYFAASTASNGLDIFMLDEGATGRQVLPSPFNSSSDDFTPYISNGMLYLGSNRPGGCGGFDLYGFAIGE